MTVALVLSGGGSRGSFEIGALEYLYEIGIWGEVICSTSVGSINGIKLAEGGSLQAQRTAFGELKQIWLEVQQNEDMYVPAPWLAGLSPRTLQALKSMMGLTTTDVLMALAWPSPFLLVDLIALGIDIDEVVGDIVNHRVRSLYELTPIQQKLQQRVNIQQVKTSGVTLRLAVVGLETGALRYVTEKGELLERDSEQPKAKALGLQVQTTTVV